MSSLSSRSHGVFDDLSSVGSRSQGQYDQDEVSSVGSRSQVEPEDEDTPQHTGDCVGSYIETVFLIAGQIAHVRLPMWIALAAQLEQSGQQKIKKYCQCLSGKEREVATHTTICS